MKDRPTSDHDRRRLKAATERSIRRAGGGTVFAALTRVEPPALSKYAAMHDDHFMPIDVALDCDMAAGAPVILAAMAASAGYTIAPAAAAAAPLCPVMVGTLIRETGEVSAVVLEAMADGRLTPRERQAIAKEIDEAMVALWTLKNAVAGDQ